MKTIAWFGFVLGAVCVAGTVHYTTPGSKVTLDCGVKSFKSNLVWHHGREMLISVDGRTGMPRKGKSDLGQHRTRVKQDTKIEIFNVRQEDVGTFSCTADGSRHEHQVVVVSVSANPPGELKAGTGVKLQCEVNGLTPGSTLQWTRPDGTIAAETGTVELQSVASSHAGTWNCIINPVGNKYSLDLVVNVIVATTAPSSTQHKGSHKTFCSTCGTKTTGPVEALHWWVWVAGGVGLLVVLLLMIFVIVTCKRIRSRKRRLKMNYIRKRPRQYCQCNRPTAAARPQQGRRKEKPSSLHVQPLLTE